MQITERIDQQQQQQQDSACLLEVLLGPGAHHGVLPGLSSGRLRADQKVAARRGQSEPPARHHVQRDDIHHWLCALRSASGQCSHKSDRFRFVVFARSRQRSQEENGEEEEKW